MVFNRFVSKRSLLQLDKGENMKVRLDIDKQYAEEQIIIEAPTLSPRVQKVKDFVQSLDQKETLKGKFQDQVFLIEIQKIQRIYIENRKVLAETGNRIYALDIRLYQAVEILPASFVQISQSEIVNIDAISHLKLTSNGLIEIYLKNDSFTYSSRRYLKAIKEKLEL
jgi:LytTr DNA-binding domain family protein